MGTVGVYGLIPLSEHTSISVHRGEEWIFMRNSYPVGHLFRKSSNREGLETDVSDGMCDFAVGGRNNRKSIDRHRSGNHSFCDQRGLTMISSALFNINLFRVCLFRAVGGYA